MSQWYAHENEKTGPDSDQLALPLAGSWSRFFARIFDVWWETLVISATAGVLLSRYSVVFVTWLNGPYHVLTVFIWLPLALTLDAIVYRLFGNTPGKALLGLRVTTIDGDPLTFVQYLWRNLSLWITGLGLGIPLINLLAFAMQAQRVNSGEQASYDERPEFRVRSQTITPRRKAVFAIAFLAFVGAIVTSKIVGHSRRHTVLESASRPSYNWENPVTRVRIQISPRWKYLTETGEDGQRYYEFTEVTNHAQVYFLMENMPGLTIDEYVHVFREALASEVQFSDEGKFLLSGGHEAWEVNGKFVADSSIRTNIRIMRLGANYWRVFSVQALPYEYSDELVEELKKSLWSTVEQKGSKRI